MNASVIGAGVCNEECQNCRSPTPTSLLKKRVAVIGMGKIGTIVIQAMLKAGLLSKEQIHATVQHPEKARALRKDLGFDVGTNNVAAADGADIVLVCVKPQQVAQILEQLAPVTTPTQLVVSVAASVSTDYMEQRLPANVPIIRAMPNTPAMIGCGMTALCKGRFADQSHVDLTRALFDTVGRTVVVDEKHMDAVTGLSRQRPSIYLHHRGVSCRSGRKGRVAARHRHFTSRADHDGRRKSRAGDGTPSGITQGRRHNSCRLHHRRHHGTGRGQTARHSY